MRREAHGGFGERPRETGRRQRHHRALGRLSLGVWCDNTGELLAIRLRPGNANANHAQDHIDLLGDAISQIPAAHRRSMLIRADSAGASHQVLDWLNEQGQVRGRSVEYSIGFPIHKGIQVHDAIRTLPEPAWRGYGCRRRGP